MNKQPLKAPNSLPSVILFDKNVGETPLEALGRLRAEMPELRAVKLSYAGRLDPMASGLLLVLVGEENKRRAHYLNLDKTYRAKILFGFGTDSFDLLGKITACNDEDVKKSLFEKVVRESIGKFIQPYPPFSSKTYKGKPLFSHTKEGTLPDSLPTRDVEIYNMKIIGYIQVSGSWLEAEIIKKIKKVRGNFRQKEIIEGWQQALRIQSKRIFTIAEIEVSCSSGTYIRSLAEDYGQKMGTPALAFSICRTKITY